KEANHKIDTEEIKQKTQIQEKKKINLEKGTEEFEVQKQDKESCIENILE
ncbi:15256_t:CDS:1, partial [Cetraspora pellucida]